MDQVSDEKYPIPEVNARYHALTQEIIQRYGVTFGVEAVTSFSKDSEEIFAASGLNESKPTVSFFIPKIMNVYAKLWASRVPDWEKQFEDDIVISMLHELDHLALGEVGLPSDTTDDLIAHEEKVWAQTCEHSISVFVAERYPLSQSKLAYWNDWVACGKRENSCWKAAIAGVYAPIGNSRKR